MSTTTAASQAGLRSAYRIALGNAEHASDRARVEARIIAIRRDGIHDGSTWNYRYEPRVAEWIATANEWTRIANTIGDQINWDHDETNPPF